MNTDNQAIYKMQLHDTLNFNGDGFCVTRVASGWIYDFIAYNRYKGGIVFVPFDNTFQPKG